MHKTAIQRKYSVVGWCKRQTCVCNTNLNTKNIYKYRHTDTDIQTYKYTKYAFGKGIALAALSRLSKYLIIQIEIRDRDTDNICRNENSYKMTMTSQSIEQKHPIQMHVSDSINYHHCSECFHRGYFSVSDNGRNVCECRWLSS